MLLMNIKNYYILIGASIRLYVLHMAAYLQ